VGVAVNSESGPSRLVPEASGVPCISLRCTNRVAAHWAGHQERLPYLGPRRGTIDRPILGARREGITGYMPAEGGGP
jgi:hypothetical protein